MIAPMLAEAWHAMSANRLRSFLTMLGMMIGVAAVIMMLAVGQGAQFAVDQSIASMGSNLFIVMSGSTTSGGIRLGMGATPTLTTGDAEAISELASISEVSPVAPGTAQLVYGSNNWSTMVAGTTPNYLVVRDWAVESGYPFTDSDVRSATRVVLLGHTVAQNLFGDADPVGKTIRIKQSPFLVIGLLAMKGQSLDGRDQDDTALVPVTTAQTRLFGTQFPGSVRFIVAQATSAEAMIAAERDMTQLLRQRHHLAERTDNDFDVRNLTALANAAAQTTRVMSIMLGAIASVSLLVGGIGIMNIMLVSVTERTREIGLRMAVGARGRDILLQFLIEALSMACAGGAIGVATGIGTSYLVSSFGRFPTVITAFSIILGFVSAAFTGVIFGFYPARRAAMLDPIDALRYE
jgi:putative ABC transport system permease protein